MAPLAISNSESHSVLSVTPNNGKICYNKNQIPRPCNPLRPPMLAPSLTIETKDPESPMTESLISHAAGRTVSFVYPDPAPTSTAPQQHLPPCVDGEMAMGGLCRPIRSHSLAHQPSISGGELTATIMQPYTTTAELKTTVMQQPTSLGERTATVMQHSTSLGELTTTIIVRRDVPVTPSPTTLATTETISTSELGSSFSPSPTPSTSLHRGRCRTKCPVEDMEKWSTHCWLHCRHSVPRETYRSSASKWLASFKTAHSKHRATATNAVSSTALSSPLPVTQNFWNSIAIPSLSPSSLATLSTTAIQTREKGDPVARLLPRATVVPSVPLSHAPFSPPPAANATLSTGIGGLMKKIMQRDNCYGPVCGPGKNCWALYCPRWPPSKPKAIEPRDFAPSSENSSISAIESFNRTENVSAPALLSSSISPRSTSESERKIIANRAMYMQSLTPVPDQMQESGQQSADLNTPFFLTIIPSSPLETSLPKASVASSPTRHTKMDGGHIVDMIYWPCVLAILVVLIALWISTKSYKVRYRGPWAGEWPDNKQRRNQEEEGEANAGISKSDDRFLIQNFNRTQSYGTLGQSQQTNDSPSGKYNHATKSRPQIHDDDFSWINTLAKPEKVDSDGTSKDPFYYYSDPPPPDLKSFISAIPDSYYPVQGRRPLTKNQLPGQSSRNNKHEASAEAKPTGPACEQERKQVSTASQVPTQDQTQSRTQNQATPRRDLHTYYREHNPTKAEARARSIAALTADLPTSNPNPTGSGNCSNDSAAPIAADVQPETNAVLPGSFLNVYTPFSSSAYEMGMEIETEMEGYDGDEEDAAAQHVLTHALDNTNEPPAFQFYGSMRGMEPCYEFFPIHGSEERNDVPSQQGAVSHVEKEGNAEGYGFPPVA